MQTSTYDFPVPYGVSHNTEMCAPAIMYYPHDPDSHDVAFIDIYSYTFRQRYIQSDCVVIINDNNDIICDDSSLVEIIRSRVFVVLPSQHTQPH